MSFVSRDTSVGAYKWTVEFGGTQGWIVSDWYHNEKRGWVQGMLVDGVPIRELVLRDVDDFAALIVALTVARDRLMAAGTYAPGDAAFTATPFTLATTHLRKTDDDGTELGDEPAYCGATTNVVRYTGNVDCLECLRSGIVHSNSLSARWYERADTLQRQLGRDH